MMNTNMDHIYSTEIEDYNYHLPLEKIAQYPSEKRDESKLLFYNGEIKQDVFLNIDTYIPDSSLLIFNQTKVVMARMNFQKESGAHIEVFCLEPIEPYTDFQLAFECKNKTIWRCMLGHAKKWKSGSLTKLISIENQEIELVIHKIKKEESTYLVSFEWSSLDYSFAQIMDAAGYVPLPPYMNRDAEDTDKMRYQTTYAKLEGSVAAPTAGLHFTKDTFASLEKKSVRSDFVTLHVGAGTFKPVQSKTMEEHEMHTEKIILSRKNLLNIQEAIGKRNICTVGTTSMRTIESAFWFGAKLCVDKESVFQINQWDAYQKELNEITAEQSIEAILSYMNNHDLDEIKGITKMIILPGYTFRFANSLITNFHQPKSTLLLLVSALIGEDWKKVYDYALENEYRFLSYGDSCFFMPKK